MNKLLHLIICFMLICILLASCSNELSTIESHVNKSPTIEAPIIIPPTNESPTLIPPIIEPPKLEPPIIELPTIEPLIIDLPTVRLSSQKEIRSQCKELYYQMLTKYKEYPSAFIRFCVATTQKSGSPKAYQGMCAYRVVWESIEAGVFGVSEVHIISRKDCIDYFKSLNYWSTD